MIELYEKKQKTSENPYGSQKVTFGNNPFMRGPVLLCIGDDPSSRSVAKNTTNYLANVLRLRTQEADNASISMENFPINLVSYHSVLPSNHSKKQEIEDFVDQYLGPLVHNNFAKIHPTRAMKNMRNVNIATFGNGAFEANRIEDQLLDLLTRVGYSEEETRQILSQVFAIFIGAPKVKFNEQFTSVSFTDLEDSTIDRSAEHPALLKIFRDKLKYDPLHEEFRSINPNFFEYCRRDETTKHTLEDYYSKGKAFPVIISSVMYRGLNNSAVNHDATEVLLPLHISQLTDDAGNYMAQARQGVSTKTIMDSFDQSIAYPGKKVLTDGEKKLIDQLDIACDHITSLLNNREQKTTTLPGVTPNDTATTLPGLNDSDIDR